MKGIVPFRFEEKEVRVVKDENGSPWFVLKDVCRVLGVVNSNDAASRLDDDEKDGVGLADPIGRTQQTTIINESGLYSVILRSGKPEAQRFRKWVTSEVLPTIRKTGTYSTTSPPPPRLDLPLLAKHFRASIAIAKASGLKGDRMVLSANIAVYKNTGVDCLDLLNAKHFITSSTSHPATPHGPYPLTSHTPRPVPQSPPHLTDFITDRCVLDTNALISSARLYDEYCKWCKSHSRKPIGKRSFGIGLKEQCLVSKRGTKGIRMWAGISLARRILD